MDDKIFYCNACINMDKVKTHLLSLREKYGDGKIPIDEAMKIDLEINFLPSNTK